jgi:hypothetical protein
MLKNSERRRLLCQMGILSIADGDGFIKNHSLLKWAAGSRGASVLKE